jgi:hypothetical protein
MMSAESSQFRIHRAANPYLLLVSAVTNSSFPLRSNLSNGWKQIKMRQEELSAD